MDVSPKMEKIAEWAALASAVHLAHYSISCVTSTIATLYAPLSSSKVCLPFSSLVYRVTMVARDYILLTCPTALPFLPHSHLPKQNGGRPWNK